MQTLFTPRLQLVPYDREHVPKYHVWMQDAELREQVCVGLVIVNGRTATVVTPPPPEDWQRGADARGRV